MTRQVLLKECSCVVGEELRLAHDVDLVIEDGVIVELGPGACGGHGLRATGLVVFPGLINCHTHIGDAAFADRWQGLRPQELLWPPDGLRYRWMAETEPQVLADAMRVAAKRMLATGTIAFVDFREQGRAGVQLLRDAVDDLPIRSIILGRPEAFPLHSEEELAGNEVRLSEQVRAEVAATLEVADGYCLAWANDTTDPGLADVHDMCRGRGARSAVHAGASARFREVSEARTERSDVERIVRHLRPDFVVHMTVGRPDEFAMLREAEIPVVMCPRTQAALGAGIPPMLLAMEHGVQVALGTDNVMVSAPDLLAELNFFARVLAATTGDPTRPSATQLLSTVTTAAARTVGLDDSLGRIDVGYEASLFLLDMTTQNLRYSSDPIAALVSRATPADIRTVLAAGEVVHGELPPAG